MDKIQEIKEKVGRLVAERGLSFNSISLKLGKNQTYLQKFVKEKSPKRLDEAFRKDLAKILEVDEQELTDIPLGSVKRISNDIDEKILLKIISKIEELEDATGYEYSAADKAKLIKLIYLKITQIPESEQEEEAARIINIYDFMRKAN